MQKFYIVYYGAIEYLSTPLPYTVRDNAIGIVGIVVVQTTIRIDITNIVSVRRIRTVVNIRRLIILLGVYIALSLKLSKHLNSSRLQQPNRSNIRSAVTEYGMLSKHFRLNEVKNLGVNDIRSGAPAL